jgi:hypothetical protein
MTDTNGKVSRFAVGSDGQSSKNSEQGKTRRRCLPVHIGRRADVTIKNTEISKMECS